MKLRSQLLLFALATLLPMAIIGAAVAYLLSEREREAFQRGAIDRVRALMTAVDADPDSPEPTAGPGDGKTDPIRRGAQLRADLQHLVLEARHVLTNRSANLDDRLMHLALDVIAECGRTRREQLRDMGPQFPRCGIDDLKLFLDADGEGAGLRNGFHLGAARIDNPEALRTLRNGALSSIETARCLWHDYGAPDPGLCR